MSWKTVKLGEILEVENGFAFSSKLFAKDGKIGLIRIRDLKDGWITDTKYNGEYKKQYIVNAGDYLIGMDGEFQCYIWKGKPALLNQRVCRLNSFSKNIEKRFIYYSINRELKKIEENTGFITVKHLSSKSIKQIEINVPPLQQQRQIVERLDRAFEEIGLQISNVKSIIENLKQLSSNYVTSVFKSISQEHKKLEEITEITNGYAFKSGDFISKDGIKVIKITNVGIQEFIETDEQLPNNYASEYSKFRVKTDDIVFALTRTIINDGLKIAKIPESYNGALLNQRVAAVSAISSVIDKNYLFQFLSSKSVKDYVKYNVNELMQPNLSIIDLKNLKVPFVSKKEQSNMAEKFDKFDENIKKLLGIYQKKYQQLINLKSAILTQALTPS